MQNTLLMEVLQREEHTGYEELGLLLVKLLILGEVVPEVSSLHEIDDQVQVLPVFEGVVHIYQESKWILTPQYLRVIQLTQELLLVHHRVHTSLRDYPRLQHFLHGVQLVCLLLFHSPHLAEAAPANDIHE